MYTSGVDPSIVQFEYAPADLESDWKLWVKATVYYMHTHDVRDLVVAKDKLVSGGKIKLVLGHVPHYCFNELFSLVKYNK